MTQFVFANFINTTLAAAVSSSSDTITLSSSVNLPTLASGEILPIILNDAATRSVFEVVYVTAINGATLTVERAQEGTSAQNWNVGDYAYTGPTAGTVSPVVSTHSPTASETLPVANRLVVTPGTLAGGTGVTAGTILPNPAVPKGGYEDYVFTFTAIGASPTLTVEAVGGNSTALL